MGDKDPFGVSLEDQLARWKAKIDDSKAEAEKKGPAFFDRYAADLEKMLGKYETARYKLTLLRKGGSDALHDLKEGFEGAFGELKSAVTKALDKL
jgi:DNA-binding protein HU-beta